MAGVSFQARAARLRWSEIDPLRLTWRGLTSVRTDDGTYRTSGEDGYILVLPTPSSPDLDLTADISCEWRPGDVW